MKGGRIGIVSNILAFFALFEEDMNRNGFNDQNNDNIIDQPQNILEEDVEDDDDNNNEVVLIFPLYYNKKPNFWLFKKSKYFRF